MGIFTVFLIKMNPLYLFLGNLNEFDVVERSQHKLFEYHRMSDDFL